MIKRTSIKPFLKTLFVLLCTLSSILVMAQKEINFKGPIAYLELGGSSAPTVSVNLEHLIFTKNEWHINGHAGYGIGKVDGNNAFAIPIGINAFHGIKNSHIEGGLGITYVNGYRAYYLGSDAVLSKALYFAPNIAYRFQKPTGGFFLRVTYTPLFRLQEFSKPENRFPDSMKTHLNFGIGLGYFFARSKKIDKRKLN